MVRSKFNMKHADAWTFALLFGVAFVSHSLRVHGGTKAPKMTLEQLRTFARAQGFPDPDLAAAVAYAESGGRPSVIVPEPHGSPSYGLWQIHLSDHPQYDATSLLDPVYNAKAAFAISRGGTDWSAWSTFKNGLHVRYMPNIT